MIKKKTQCIAYLDEAGRGPLAGPVTAAAVLFRQIPNSLPGVRLAIDGTSRISKMKDSKKLTAQKREELYKIFIKNAQVEWAIAKVSEKVIDRINILEATKLVMERAVEELRKKNGRLKIDHLILDGNFKINSKIPQKSIIKADERILGCKISSIIAKVYRDRIMKRYHQKFPQYGFAQHKGYGTKYHLRMLKKYGPCEIHRKSFEPVRKLKM